jgi:hypothetical protein
LGMASLLSRITIEFATRSIQLRGQHLALT